MAKGKSSKGHGFIGTRKSEGYAQETEFSGSKGGSVPNKGAYDQKTGFGKKGNKIK